MRIDSHQHFWKYNAAEYGWIDDSMSALKRDFLPDESAREMARVGFDACVAVQARQTLDETRWLLSLADHHPSIAGVVGWVDLQADALRGQLTEFAGQHRLVGVRHIAQTEPDDGFLLRPQVIRGIGLLADFGLAFDILIYRRQLGTAAELVGRLPGQRFVLDHLAKPDIRSGEIDQWEQDIRRLAAHPNVFAKLSGLVTEASRARWTSDQIRPYLDVAFDAFGWHRLMIGSDWPVCTVAADYARTMNVVIDYVAARPEHERDAVLGGNAQRFWRLRSAVAIEAEARKAERASGERA
jgi:L-fuconolactonase